MTKEDFEKLIGKTCKFYGIRCDISEIDVEVSFLERVDLDDIHAYKNSISNNAIALMIIAKENGVPLKDIYTAYKYQQEIYGDEDYYTSALRQITGGYLEETLEFGSMVTKGEAIEKTTLEILKAYISMFSEME